MLLATIPFRTFPEIPGTPINTFGLFVALGILVGLRLGARLIARAGGDPELFERLGTRAAIAGLVGARLAWVVTHPSEIDSVLDVFAVWNGGLQFSGGFLLGVLVVLPTLARTAPLERRRIGDAGAFGVVVGQAIGRVGCIAVGEHWGGPTDHPLGLRYLGGATAEGDLTVGVAYHNTALYELLHLAVLGAILWGLYRTGRLVIGSGRATGLFLVWYGLLRAATDVVRVGDERLLGLTGAQWVGLAVLVPAGLWVLSRSRDREPGPTAPGESVSA